MADQRAIYKVNDYVTPDKLEDVLNEFAEEGYQVDGKHLVVTADPPQVYFIVTGFDPALLGSRYANSMASMMGFGGLKPP
jgi:hypothetical protein